jgi:hypothetical protein
MVTSTELRQVALPARTETYIPVPHGDFIDTVLEFADKKNYILRHDSYNAAKNGNVMSGVFAFRGDDPLMDMQVGIVNSYDKSKTAIIGIGSQVIICQNGLVSADFTLRRKHTGSVVQDLITMIEGGFEQMYDEYVRNIQLREVLAQIELNKTNYAEIVGRMYLEHEIITPTQLSVVKEEYRDSKLFPEPTAWSMYNHVNQALKKGHPADYIDSHINLHKFMVEEFA